MYNHDDVEGAVYPDRTSAEQAVDRLKELGYPASEISVLMNDKTHTEHFAEDKGVKVTNDTMAGAAFGGGLGAIIAGLTATGSIAAIAGTGGLAAPVVAGPLAAALAGLGAGALGGGIIGSLVGVGIPEHRAKEYHEQIEKGGIYVGLKPTAEHRDTVRDVFGTRTSV